MSTITLRLRAHEHPIKSVTVFRSPAPKGLRGFVGTNHDIASRQRAEVTRTFSVDLKAGHNEVNVTGLSGHIDTRSVRVSGLGDNTTLFDVVCTVSDEEDPEQTDSSKIIRLLQAEKSLLEGQKDIRDREAELLFGYGKTLQGDANVSPSSMASFLDNFLERGQKILEAKAELTKRITDIDRQVEEETRKAPTRVGKVNGKVTIVISSEGGGHVDLTLTYIVTHAAWMPIYDLLATTDKGTPVPSVALQYRARICQTTGEDWTDAKLVLSTATSDTVADGVPDLAALKIKARLEQKSSVTWPHTDTTGGLFGQNTQQSQGLFGNKFHANQPLAGLFGNAATTSQPSAFGGATALPATQPSQSLFGNTSQANQAQASLFGGATVTSQPSGFGAFGGGAFGSVQPAGSGPSFGQQQQVRTGLLSQTLERERDRDRARSTGPPEDDYFEAELVDVPEAARIVEPTTTVSVSPFSMLYKADRNATIPSDGKAHQVLIASLTFNTSIARVAVPRKKLVAYLQCRVKNTSDYRLLPGSVRVFLDEGYVSTTSIRDVNAGESFDCILGVDTSIHLSYRRSSSTVKEAQNAFSEQFKIVTYTVETIIRNKHLSQISELVIRDAIPHASSLPLVPADKVRIILREPATFAEAKSGKLLEVGNASTKIRWVSKDDQTEGEYEWVCKLDGNGETKLVLKYEIKAPVDYMWQESIV